MAVGKHGLSAWKYALFCRTHIFLQNGFFCANACNIRTLLVPTGQCVVGGPCFHGLVKSPNSHRRSPWIAGYNIVQSTLSYHQLGRESVDSTQLHMMNTSRTMYNPPPHVHPPPPINKLCPLTLIIKPKNSFRSVPQNVVHLLFSATLLNEFWKNHPLTT